MSRIASVKETGEEISQTDWQRFERAVQSEVAHRERPVPAQAAAAQSRPKPAANQRKPR